MTASGGTRPCLRTGGDVLHHLFCVIGNGYKWVDGELVPIDLEREVSPYKDVVEPDLSRFRELLEGLPEPLLQEMLRERATELEAERQVAVEATERSKNWGYGDVTEFYPESGYAKLFHIPSDVKPDWVEAAEYMRGEASKKGWTLNPPKTAF